MADTAKLCSDCARVQRGLRSVWRPHQYMVRSHAEQPDSAPAYRCLLCGTALAWERREREPRRKRDAEARA